MEKSKKEKEMTLSEYYSSLPKMRAPKTELRKGIALKCGVSIETARLWLAGRTPLKKEHCEIVSEITGISVNALFPSHNDKYGKN